MSRVLVIDDSPMLVELTVRALASAGYHATGATDLASLDQKLTEGPFALILMDVNMPEMFGDDVVEYLRTQKRVTSKLVLYSDISEEELAAKTRNSGADAYILKGGGIEAVIAGIMRILGAPTATASATAPARPATAPAPPATRPVGTTASPRPPAVAPATRPAAAPAGPRPTGPGVPVNGATPPRVAPATAPGQAIPGQRAPVAGQVAQPRPPAQAPMAGAHPAPAAAPRAPVAGQVAQPRPPAQAPMAGAHPAPATAPRTTAPAATAQAPAPGMAHARPVAPAAAHPTAPAAHAAPAQPAPAAHGPAPVPVAPQVAAPAQAPATPPAPVAPPAPAAPSPAAAPAPAATGGFPSAAKMAAAAGRKPRILIVDDSEMTARIIEADLVTKGFEVHIADSADKATKIILKKQTRPDLVLLDVRMPNVNGEQFCRFIKSNSLFKGIKVLLCSGENVEELQRICREAGADGYLPKDAVMSRLVARELNAAPGQE
jgi:DNA-binding response OmpR family regulator